MSIQLQTFVINFACFIVFCTLFILLRRAKRLDDAISVYKSCCATTPETAREKKIDGDIAVTMTIISAGSESTWAGSGKRKILSTGLISETT